MSNIITVDPGHGGIDGGASVYENGKVKYAEKDLTLKMALYSNEFLTADNNYTPILARKSDITTSTDSKIKICNTAKSDLMMSLHMNAGGGNGIEAYPNNPIEAYHAESYRFAEAVMANMKDLTPIRGLNGIRYCYHIGNDVRRFVESNDKNPNRYSTYYGVVRDTKCPAALIESGFIDNTTNMKLFDTDAELKIVAARYYRAICDFFKTTPIFDANGNMLLEVFWRVQVGAFKNKLNAEIFCAEVKAAGYAGSFVTLNDRGFNCVQVGAFSIKDNANAYMEKIKKDRYQAFLVEVKK